MLIFFQDLVIFMQLGKSEAFLGLRGGIYSRVACLMSEIHKFVLYPTSCVLLTHSLSLIPTLKLPVSVLAYYTLPFSELSHPRLYLSRIYNRPWLQLLYQVISNYHHTLEVSIGLEFKYKFQNLSFKVYCLPVSTFLLQVIQKLYAVFQSPILPHYLPFSALMLLFPHFCLGYL